MPRWLRSNVVPLVFGGLCLALCVLSRQPAEFLVGEMSTRLVRNAFTTLSLIIPVLAGLGLNFGIVVGAMAAQAAVVATVHWQLGGFGGFLAAWMLALPLAIVLGWLVGLLLNRAKGREMVTSLIAGFFANGIYQLVFLFLVGSVIPFAGGELLLPKGYGLRNTVNLTGLSYGLDDLASASWTGHEGWELMLGGRPFEPGAPEEPAAPEEPNAPGAPSTPDGDSDMTAPMKLPFATFGLIGLLCLGTRGFLRTKLGQDMRAVGQDMHIAEVAGIAVDRVRITAVVISTVLAAWGHLIYLQNMGTLNTYSSHEQIGMFAVAAILVGGASVTRATVGQALMGTVLFHLLFVTSPLAGKHLVGDAQIGEYFRVFVAYGVIAIALALHAWRGVQRSVPVD